MEVRKSPVLKFQKLIATFEVSRAFVLHTQSPRFKMLLFIPFLAASSFATPFNLYNNKYNKIGLAGSPNLAKRQATPLEAQNLLTATQGLSVSVQTGSILF